jgi:hypothetical protein
MSDDNQNEKNQAKKRRETSDEFCRRLGIRTVNEKGGVEFSPYHGGHLSGRKPPTAT